MYEFLNSVTCSQIKHLNVVHTCNPSKAAVGHVAGCSLQIVFINQLQLVLVTMLYIPSSGCTHKDQQSLYAGFECESHLI